MQVYFSTCVTLVSTSFLNYSIVVLDKNFIFLICLNPTISQGWFKSEFYNKAFWSLQVTLLIPIFLTMQSNVTYLSQTNALVFSHILSRITIQVLTVIFWRVHILALMKKSSSVSKYNSTNYIWIIKGKCTSVMDRTLTKQSNLMSSIWDKLPLCVS